MGTEMRATPIGPGWRRALTRRQALGGALAGGSSAAAWLAACGGSSGKSDGSSRAAPAGTVSANAPVAADVDPEKLIPEGIKKNFPLIYQYHWSRQTFSKNQPKYGGKFVSHTIGDAPAWDPVDPAATNASFMQLFFNRLVKADMSYE